MEHNIFISDGKMVGSWDVDCSCGWRNYALTSLEAVQESAFAHRMQPPAEMKEHRLSLSSGVPGPIAGTFFRVECSCGWAGGYIGERVDGIKFGRIHQTEKSSVFKLPDVPLSRNYRRLSHCLEFKARVDVIAESIQHALQCKNFDFAASQLERIQELSKELKEKLEKEL